MGSKRFRRKADDKRTPLCPELIRAALGLGDMSVGGGGRGVADCRKEVVASSSSAAAADLSSSCLW